jgi:GWxTD domain-containing protein
MFRYTDLLRSFDMFRTLLFLSFLVISFTGCVPVGSISNENFSFEYRDEEKNLHPELTVFNFNADSSRLYILLNTSEFLFTKQEEDTFRASFRVSLRILDSYESSEVKGTAQQSFSINKTLEGVGRRIYTLDFILPPPGEYLIECNIFDSNKKITETDYVNLDNSSAQSRQNFQLHRIGSSAPVFANYVAADDTFSIEYREKESQNIIVKYYKREFLLAAPPYSFDMRDQFNYAPDSVFSVTTGGGYKYTFLHEGIYHLQLDSSNHEGETIYRFSPGFPGVSTFDALLNPLRYITTRKEFEELRSNPNKKQAVDQFWLDVGGNQERSRQLIKKYYSRVEKANRLFSSYMEGWRTDRGMIYVIFGSPHSVYKSSNTESWTYGEANSSLSITFNFTKVTNPFSDNDFSLTRAPIYESNWYRAVDTWRQGRVFNDF